MPRRVGALAVASGHSTKYQVNRDKQPLEAPFPRPGVDWLTWFLGGMAHPIVTFWNLSVHTRTWRRHKVLLNVPSFPCRLRTATTTVARRCGVKAEFLSPCGRTRCKNPPGGGRFVARATGDNRVRAGRRRCQLVDGRSGAGDGDGGGSQQLPMPPLLWKMAATAAAAAFQLRPPAPTPPAPCRRRELRGCGRPASGGAVGAALSPPPHARGSSGRPART